MRLSKLSPLAVTAFLAIACRDRGPAPVVVSGSGENEIAKEYLETVKYLECDYEGTAIDAFDTLKTDFRKDQPSPLVVNWDNPGGLDKITLLVSADKKMKDPVISSELSPDAVSEPVFNLVPGKEYHFRVDGVKEGKRLSLARGILKAEGPLRMIRTDALHNVRDIGGWKTADGKTIKYGLIFRGGQMNRQDPPTEADIDLMKGRLGIKADVDLRWDSELDGGTPDDPSDDLYYTPLGEGVEYAHMPVNLYDPGNADTTAWRNMLSFVMDHVIAGEPCYIHCAAGADRTGTTCFLLEGLLGVPEESLSKEHELTSFSTYGRRRRNDPDAYKHMVTYILDREGDNLRDKFEDYFINHIGIPEDKIEAFRAAALNPALPARGKVEGPCTENGEVIPIMAWHSIPAGYASLETYQELADAGFNINFSHIGRLEDALKALELGEKTGVKIMFTCSELSTDTGETVRKVKDHPALYGYFLKDEPWCGEFPGLAAWARRIEEADSTHTLYLNLFPNAIDLPLIGAKDYRDYVHRFIEEVGLPLVSFDHYPVKNDGLHEEWYDNLEVIRDESASHGLPFWAFAMCVPHWHYPMPQPRDLRLEMYTNLAYGASGLQYFTYWSPGPSDPFNYHDGPISHDGRRNPMYGKVKALNKELQSRAGVFIGSIVKDVSFTGNDIPEGTKPLEGLPEGVSAMDTHGGRLLVSQIEKEGKRFLVLVSTSIEKTVDLDISFKKVAREVDREGMYVRIGKNPATYHISPGDEVIFRTK